MSLSKNQIQQLQRLLRGETIAWSSLNTDMRNTLIGEDLIIIKTNRSRKSIYVPNAEALKMFLEHHFEELRGMDWRSEDFSTAISRSELAANSGNSKTKEIRSCPGFMVNSYEPISAKLNSKGIVIAPKEGTMLFVADWEHFEIPQEVLIVGIENMENFRCIRKQRYLFPAERPILFVSRYPQSIDLRQWLIQIPNMYLHFGDFDLAGIHIYESEFYRYLGARASFFIPDDIEFRIANGSLERYNAQYDKFKNYKPHDNKLFPLFEIINRYHRCYDQEGYIERHYS